MSGRRLRSVPSGDQSRKAVVYVRVSSVKGRAGESFHSPDLQEAACRRLAEQQGLDVLEVVVDLDTTGRTFDRAGIRTVMALAADRAVDAVVIYDLSRLGRNTSESLRHIRELRDAGVAVLSTAEKIDDTPEGQFALTTFLGMAQLYSDQLARRWREVHRANADAGRWHGHPPVGYVRGGNGLEVDPVAAPLVVEAFTAYAAGATLAEVTEVLRRVPGRESYWRSSTRALLRNLAYRGMVTLAGVTSPGRHEALVDDATWARVQARLEAATWVPPRQHEPTHPFARLVVCDACDGPMIRHGSATVVASRSPGRVHHYRCRKALNGLCTGAGSPPSDVLEQVVLAQVTAFLADLRTDPVARGDARARATRAKAAVKRLDGELRKVRDARGRLTVDRARRDVTAADYRAALGELEADEARMVALREVEAAAAVAGPRVTVRAAEGLLARWPVATMAERNRMLRDVVRQIRVRPPARWREPLEGRVEVLFV